MSLDPDRDRIEPAPGRFLTSHPDTPARSVESVEVDVKLLRDGILWLRYHIEVPEEELALPNPAAPERADGLWQTTCCEIFLRRPDEKAYLEFNFSPSSRWAAYAFSGYREGGRNLELAVPEIFLDASSSHLSLEAQVQLPGQWTGIALNAGLSAVIEEVDGTKSYWALAHPPGKPDFHHPDCFALTLGAPERA